MFSSFGNPFLNNNGQVAYEAFLQSGTGGVDLTNNSGIWRDNSLIARKGFQAPSTPSGALFSAFRGPVLNNNGQVAYLGFLQNGTGGVDSTNDIGIWRDNSLIVREGFQAPGTPNGALFSGFGFNLGLNDNNQVAYQGLLRLGAGGVDSSNNRGIWRDNSLIARTGFQAPGMPNGDLFFSFSNPAINNNGQLAYFASTTSENGIWRDDSLIARTGGQAPGTPSGALFFNLHLSNAPPLLNNNGQVAYQADLQFGSGGVNSTNDKGIWLDNTLIARKGSQASAMPAGAVFSEFSTHILNDNGQVAYQATLQTGSGGVSLSNDTGIWLDNRSIVREGGLVSGTNSGELVSSLSTYDLNNNGQVAYKAFLKTGVAGVDFSNDLGVWINGSNGDTLEVIREGDVVDGNEVVGITLIESDFSRGNMLNDFSQLTYRALFSNGDDAVVLFTPDLHWLSTDDSQWDTASNWTIAQDPGEVHDVFITPSTNLTITGSSRVRTVKQLTVGGGTGIGTLSLNGGNLTALNGVNIASTGVLTGTGVITGTVSNQGEVRAENLTISGGNLVNQGQIRGQTSGFNRINATVVNTASGEIELINNESLRLTQGGHTNDGRVTVIGSRLTVDGSFDNNTAGRIQGRNALLEFNGGLSNSGQVQLSFGTSDVFGEITNNNTGSVINSGGGNVTFYDDIKNNGEVRTSSGSQSVFFGEYTGTGVLTGSGSNQFEGGFSPGASPFMATSTADVSFGFINHTTIELAGSVRGLGVNSEYDGLDVLNDKTLSLDGILDVLLIDDLTPGYSPSLDDMFLIFTAGLIEGDFHTINLPTLDLGLDWLVQNDGQNFTLSVAAVPLPAGIWLFLSAIAGMMALQRRK